ncbi:MAG: hypothetical protein ABW139_06640 [Candidatus Thiodiazotropha sp. DIVDIV]
MMGIDQGLRQTNPSFPSFRLYLLETRLFDEIGSHIDDTPNQHIHHEKCITVSSR